MIVFYLITKRVMKIYTTRHSPEVSRISWTKLVSLFDEEEAETSCSPLGIRMKSLQCCFGSRWAAVHFPTAALTVLGFALGAGKALRTHRSFGYCWAGLAQHQLFLPSIPPIKRMGLGKILGENIQVSRPKKSKGISHTTGHQLRYKS